MVHNAAARSTWAEKEMEVLLDSHLLAKSFVISLRQARHCLHSAPTVASHVAAKVDGPRSELEVAAGLFVL